MRFSMRRTPGKVYDPRGGVVGWSFDPELVGQR
jgi:hypothetical protein